ncbi:MAG: VWA domain-containing protein [Desulfobulbaceae bacterium]|nr:VWA domain-containing protein [Desulfobulbaceae bacterium]
MNNKEISSFLSKTFAADFMDEWEITEYTNLIEQLPPSLHHEILHHLKAFWPISHALCTSFLEQAPHALNCFTPNHLSTWVKMTLETYETHGLAAARSFMLDVENNFICRLKGKNGLQLQTVSIKLNRYLNGLSNKSIKVKSGSQVSTNSEQILLPGEMKLYKDNDRNFLAYKTIVSFQWAFIANKSCFLDHPAFPSNSNPILFFNQTPYPQLTADLYLLVETQRALVLLRQELPGLMKEAKGIFLSIADSRPAPDHLKGANYIIEAVQLLLLGKNIANHLPPTEQVLYYQVIEILKNLSPKQNTTNTVNLVNQLLILLQPYASDYQTMIPLPFQGRPDYESAQIILSAQRDKAKQQAITALGALLPQIPASPAKPEDEEDKPDSSQKLSGDNVLLIQPKQETKPVENRISLDTTLSFITVDEMNIEIPKATQDILQEIKNDFGYIPESYISSGLQIKGNAQTSGSGPPLRDGPELIGKFIYDEWDYRRGGNRKNWCQLFEKNIQSIKTNFVEQTLDKYHGVLMRLRRQFEMMLVSERFLKRQRDGDNIDLDALIESLSDTRAGLAPSERLFIKLQRDERSICTVFLVDMSNSTEGWVSKAIKEALILMCESLEILGDSYAIYGFSGMRRLRSDLYLIKEFSHPYNQEIKGKISAIGPKEYTRMGPPIRHASRKLLQTDAKIKLLVTITDGKPEDYDDYKGDYAIEDTRHALIEAKMAGIHPFCITIDQKAKDYMAHMFGEINYIFINDVAKLPNRVPEIYRTLTT